MRLIETKGNIAEDGSIILPPGMLDSMRMESGDIVSLAYLSHNQEKPVNSYGEFFITESGFDQVSGSVELPEQAELSIPNALLLQAGIPMDADLEIQVVPGGIMISIADPLDAISNPLMKLYTNLDIQSEALRKILERGGVPDEQQ